MYGIGNVRAMEAHICRQKACAGSAITQSHQKPVPVCHTCCYAFTTYNARQCLSILIESAAVVTGADTHAMRRKYASESFLYMPAGTPCL